ncbi:MAG: glycine zipper 2TM domain-containing protein [Arenimonas sp.]|nr:glycine zipper 2TM domain-containing protein [Arenimonas sp.]
MKPIKFCLAIAITAACTLALPAGAQSLSVEYGTVTSVRAATNTSNTARNTGAVVGGLVGYRTGRNQSGSNRALRTVGGAAAGGAIGNNVGNNSPNRQTNEFSVRLVNGGTATVISDQPGVRAGDCVSVERGSSGNMRRVGSVFCEPGSNASQLAPQHRTEAQACQDARSALRTASDADFDRALTRVRAACDD